MSLVADIRVTGADLLLGDTIAAVPETTFSVVFQGGTDVLFVTAEGGETEAILAAMEADPSVADVALTAENSNHYVFRVRRTGGRTALSSVLANLGIRVVRSRTTDHGWLLRLEIPDRKHLADLRSYFEAASLEFSLERLFRPEEPATPDEFGLTDEQRTTLLEASERGHFEVPRRASQRDLADALGVSESAVSQRIRRAVGTLVENTVVASERGTTESVPGRDEEGSGGTGDPDSSR